MPGALIGGCVPALAGSDKIRAGRLHPSWPPEPLGPAVFPHFPARVSTPCTEPRTSRLSFLHDQTTQPFRLHLRGWHAARAHASGIRGDRGCHAACPQYENLTLAALWVATSSAAHAQNNQDGRSTRLPEPGCQAQPHRHRHRHRPGSRALPLSAICHLPSATCHLPPAIPAMIRQIQRDLQFKLIPQTRGRHDLSGIEACPSRLVFPRQRMALGEVSISAVPPGRRGLAAPNLDTHLCLESPSMTQPWTPCTCTRRGTQWHMHTPGSRPNPKTTGRVAAVGHDLAEHSQARDPTALLGAPSSEPTRRSIRCIQPEYPLGYVGTVSVKNCGLHLVTTSSC